LKIENCKAQSTKYKAQSTKHKVQSTKYKADDLITMSQPSDWTPLETTKHQDHVIAHVLGATVLGWAVAGEAAHLLLDIGFLWTIYLDGEMNLLPQGVALAELDADELTAADKAELALDAQELLSEGGDATGLKRFKVAPVECLITSVELFLSDDHKIVLIRGEVGDLRIDCSEQNGEISLLADRGEDEPS
jgi:hypothetical protein